MIVRWGMLAGKLPFEGKYTLKIAKKAQKKHQIGQKSTKKHPKRPKMHISKVCYKTMLQKIIKNSDLESLL